MSALKLEQPLYKLFEVSQLVTIIFVFKDMSSPCVMLPCFGVISSVPSQVSTYPDYPVLPSCSGLQFTRARSRIVLSRPFDIPIKKSCSGGRRILKGHDYTVTLFSLQILALLTLGNGYSRDIIRNGQLSSIRTRSNHPIL